ncbi:MAG: DUF3867 family protein [Inconstantimicrobium porci]|uniref:DUF3867 domain-containing protein n=1 Tax=Inconstantimicrobium porci TaxID=2652291 RepID=A0A7X2T202_9CLOT|nr:DUF3867 family protein [Inconstantimicrobium porci]MDD6770353.1 DUF3867 family protein [Inconstantimicrobium porci]MDY5911210.1 DUF3867 family protein [Inconstantimicrobium porci]MSR92144.1 DUF3867 domain-containing protein [Inconstantimicrobium porci]
MSDGVINFNEVKNKVRDKDIDKFESYIFSLYDSLSRGEISMGELSKSITEYMEKNNISQEKFLNIQKEMLKRYGFDTQYMEDQLKSMGINPSQIDQSINMSYEETRKTMSFKEKYNNKIEDKMYSSYVIKNDKNNLIVEMQSENVRLISEGKIDLNDMELNEFLCSYKKVVQDKTLNVSIYENATHYNY